MQDYHPSYPLVLTHLAQVRCVVIGGGAVAERKVASLLAGGACPEVISPALTSQLAIWKHAQQLRHIPRRYQTGDLADAFLVVAATDDRTVNAAVAAEGAALGLLVNVADDPTAGNVHTVATVRRGDLLLTVSTGGISPALAAAIHHELAEQYGEEYGLLLDLLRALRAGPAQTLTPEQRARLWQQLITPTVLRWLRSNALTQAEAYAHETLTLLTLEPRVAPPEEDTT